MTPEHPLGVFAVFGLFIALVLMAIAFYNAEYD